MAVYRLVCAFGRQRVVPVLTRCGWPLPHDILADEKHSTCLTDKGYLPTIVSGRVLCTWATVRPKTRRPAPRPMACCNARPLRTSPRTRCGVP